MPSNVVPDNQIDNQAEPDQVEEEPTENSENIDNISESDCSIPPSILRRQTSVQRELSDAIVRLAPIDELKVLLRVGADVNGQVTQGLTPLHYAVWQRYPEAVDFLIESGADVNMTDDIGFSPLHLAAEHGYIALIKTLLKHNAIVSFANPHPQEPFPMDVVDEPLRLAVKNDHYESAKLLLDNGANPNSCYFFGHEINLISPFNTEMMSLLLTYGADPNARDRQSLSPIMKACRLHQGMEAVLLLVSFGADVNLRTDARHDHRTVLHYAVLSGSVPIVNLLIKQGACVNFELEYQRPTPLDLSILKGDVPVVRLLIDAGADINASSPVIGSPLHMACTDGIKNRHEILEMLLKAGANPKQIIYSEEERPLRTVLGEYVSSNGGDLDEEIICLLLRYGAEVVMQNQNHDPMGILNDIPNLKKNPRVLITLLDAAQRFDLNIIRQSSQIDDEQRELFLEVGTTPLPLKHSIRLFLRNTEAFKQPDNIDDLQIPKILKRYLLYDAS